MTSIIINGSQRSQYENTCQENSVGEMEIEISQLLTNMPKVASIFNVVEKIGEGTFSKVFRAIYKKDERNYEEYALKYLIPTSHPTRIANEMRCLRDIGGICNVMGVKMSFMEKGHVLIVMPYFPHDKFTEYFRSLTVVEVQDYIHNLLIALNRVHSYGIIHRDVKPSNFLCNRRLKKYSLVDFGLAQRVEDLRNNAALEHHQKKLLVDRKNKMNFERTSSPIAIKVEKEKVSEKQPLHPRACKASVTYSKRPRSNEQENDAHAPSSKKKKCGSPKETPAPALLPPSSRTTRSHVRSISALAKPNPKHTGGNSEASVKPSFTKTSSPTSSKCKARSLSSQDGSSNLKQPKLKCLCYGRNEVCNICLSRATEAAPRGGTAGFRAPEVLLKLQEQTTAVDMWSAGVIFLSLLSGRYPFFRAVDDLSSLAEIMTVLGTSKVQKAAESIGKTITLSTKKPSLDLKSLCQKLRGTSSSKPELVSNSVSNPSTSKVSWRNVPNSAYDLLGRLLDPNPSSRITAEEALAHPFITEKLSDT